MLRNHVRNADEAELDLLQRCLQYEPSRRLSAAEALAHPYFKKNPEREMSHPSVDSCIEDVVETDAILDQMEKAHNYHHPCTYEFLYICMHVCMYV